MRKSLMVLVLSLGLAASVLASPATQPAAPDKPTREQVQQYLQMSEELAALFPDKKWDEAAEVCRRQIALLPQVSDAYYNLACCDARLGKPDQAIGDLQDAAAHGFNTPEHMASDDDLASLHKDKRFDQLVDQVRANEKKGPYEHGDDIKGVKTFEAFPDGGLRYRVRYSPTATAKNPQKLIVWLHPSGGSMDNVVESLAPMLNEHGYALIVFTQKRYDGWTGEDFGKAMNVSVPDLAKRCPEIDVKKPIVMGFSAGGQMAIMAYMQVRHGFSAMILDAAYPVSMQANGGYAVLPPPADPSFKSIPVYSICGLNDRGAGIWKQSEPKWLAAGIPLTVRYVPNRRHEWLFDQKYVDDLAAWLDKVHDGKLPSDPAPAPATQPATQE